MYTYKLHVHQGRRCMLLANQNRLTCLLRGQSICGRKGEGSSAPISCLKENFCGQNFEIQTQLGICCVACHFSLHVPQRRQGYQTTSESALARRPGVTRAAWTQKSRAIDEEKAPPAFSRSRALRGQKTAHSQHRRALTASERRHNAAAPK